MLLFPLAFLVLATATAAAESSSTSPSDTEALPFFFASIPDTDLLASSSIPLEPGSSSWLAGFQHYRLLPGLFPDEVDYHFDGLATLLEFSFTNTSLDFSFSRFEDQASQRWDSVNFLGTGTGPTKNGHPLSMKNPAVNLLPFGTEEQLWLTTDTVFWGSMARDDLSTLSGKPLGLDDKSTVLNAHPACDTATGECFVQYPCDPSGNPVTDQACISILDSQENGDLKTIEYSRLTLPQKFLIQHSHEPCVTKNYVVSKLDHFGKRESKGEGGVLEHLHQVEDNLWMVMDRRTNISTLYSSPTLIFVNNHFTNCVEDESGDLVMGVVPVTSNYLDVYWKDNLASARNWSSIFYAPQVCSIPVGSGTSAVASDPDVDVDSQRNGKASASINCKAMFSDASKPVYFDYPTFNPAYKGNTASSYFYAIAAKDSSTSQWFDSIIKVNTQTYQIEATWSANNVYVTEADYVARPGATAEDDGVLLSVAYNATSQTSILLVLDASSFTLTGAPYQLGLTVPFHAHGISCDPSGDCCTNP